MHGTDRITGDWDPFLETFAAELTSAAYYIAFRHGTDGSWVDLELALWRVLAETVQKWGRGLPRPHTLPPPPQALVAEQVHHVRPGL